MRRAFGVAMSFSAVINVLMLTGSIYMLQVYDRVLASGSVATLVGLFAIVVVLHVFLAFYDHLRTRLLGRAAVGLDRAVGAEAFGRWIANGRGTARDGGVNPLRDLDTLRGFLSGTAATALLDAPWVPLYVGALFIVHPTLGWLTIAGALVAVALATLNHALTRDAIARTLLREAEERELTDRARRGAEVVFAMGMQDAVGVRWQRLRDSALTAGQASSDPADALSATSRAFRMLLQSAILTAGAWLVIQGEMSGGMIVAASILSGRALAPVDQIIGQWRSIRRAMLAHKSISGLLATAPAAVPLVDLPDPEGRLSVNGVAKFTSTGARQDDRRPILDGISFDLEPGDALGLIGASGSGKSTLARLIVGAGAPDRGEIRLDGATLDQWRPARLGRHVGYLPQSPDALTGSVRDIIARFDPAIGDEEVIAAARLTGIHDLILTLPEGYGTEVGGDRGHGLSGGQAQRLGLARAVCGLPRLVVLDEPNAHLDAAGDEALGRVIGELRAAGSAVIVVTHRTSAIAAVNKLLLLDAGRVARFGDKSEVLGAQVVGQVVGQVAGPSHEAAHADRPDHAVPAIVAAPGSAVSVVSMPLPRAVALRMQRLSAQREARVALRTAADVAPQRSASS